MRNELHYTERGDLLLERKRIYEDLHPETKHGGDRKSEKIKTEEIGFDLPNAFTKDVANKIGVSRDTIENELRISRNLAPEVKETVRKHDIPKTEALKLARMEPEKQRAVAEYI